MLALVRAEIAKLATTKTFVGLVVGAAAVAALGAFSTISSTQPEALGRPVHEQSFFMLASINLALFAVVLGIRAFTDEFRYGTIVPTLLVTPVRGRVLVAKLVTFAGAGAALSAVAQAAMLALAAPLMAAKGAGVTLEGTDLAAMAGLVTASALWAAIGVAVGAIVRHQVAATVGALVWVLVVENLGAALLADGGRYLPGQAAHGLAMASEAGMMLAPAAAALVLAAYTVALSVAAKVRMSHADVAGA